MHKKHKKDIPLLIFSCGLKIFDILHTMSHSVLLICFIESEKANIHCKNKAIKQQEVCCSSQAGLY